MDNVVIIKIEGIEYEFKLKSSAILHLEKVLGKNIFDVFQDPDFTTMVHLYYACADAKCKAKYNTAENLFDMLLAEFGLRELSDKYLTEIIEKSGLIQKSQPIPMSPIGENKEKTWNK